MRIGIVNDSALAADALRGAITGSSSHEVAWIARSGLESLNRCARDHPDAILMDLAMPEMDGIQTTRQIMAVNPCAIVMVNGSHQDNTAQIFEALGAGALDAINSPDLDESGKIGNVSLLVRKLDKISVLINRSSRHAHPFSLHKAPEKGLVAIGASAGGPAAVAAILKSLPANFKAPVIVIQHVDAQFTAGLADWLNQQSQIPVRLAEEGDRPESGLVLLAAREEHLVFTSPSRLGYTRDPAETSYRPSIDVFFESVNHFWKGDVVAVLLTGMGRDGATGLRLLRTTGHRTIAQDRRTSAVYGMPKAAAELDAATEILALDKIGPRLANLFPTTKQK